MPSFFQKKLHLFFGSSLFFFAAFNFCRAAPEQKPVMEFLEWIKGDARQKTIALSQENSGELLPFSGCLKAKKRLENARKQLQQWENQIQHAHHIFSPSLGLSPLLCKELIAFLYDLDAFFIRENGETWAEKAKKSTHLKDLLQKTPWKKIEGQDGTPFDRLKAVTPGFSKQARTKIKEGWNTLFAYQKMVNEGNKKSVIQRLAHALTYSPSLYYLLPLNAHFSSDSRAHIETIALILRTIVGLKAIGYNFKNRSGLLRHHVGLTMMHYLFNYFGTAQTADPLPLFWGAKNNWQMICNIFLFGGVIFDCFDFLPDYKKGKNLAKMLSNDLFDARKKMINHQIKVYNIKLALYRTLKDPDPIADIVLGFLGKEANPYFMDKHKKVPSFFGNPSFCGAIDSGTSSTLIKKILTLLLFCLWMPIGCNIYQGIKPVLWKTLHINPLKFPPQSRKKNNLSPNRDFLTQKVLPPGLCPRMLLSDPFAQKTPSLQARDISRAKNF